MRLLAICAILIIMEYRHRTLENYLVSHIGKGKAIVIYGPRQAGKTTLANKLLHNYNPKDIAQYQTDDPAQAKLFTPNVDVLKRIVHNKKVLFIDEAQMIENAGLVLKLLVDTFPKIQVIATGSSSFVLSDKIKESMVGRVVPATLYPFSVEELAPDGRDQLLFDLNRSMRFGGYPGVILNDDVAAKESLNTIAESYLYKDILDLTETRNPAMLKKLLVALALQVGQEVSYNELSNMLEISRTMVERYIYLLEQSFVIFRLNPLSSNPRKLLSSRKRKIYFYDLGIRNVVAGQQNIPQEANPLLGGLFENFCILERLKMRQNHNLYANMYYWRSPDSEVDYLEQYDGKMFAYEIKWQKKQKKAPLKFTTQFGDARFSGVTRDNYWDMLKNGIND